MARPNNEIENSFIPREFYIVEKNLIKPTHRSEREYKSECNGSSWETQIFPSLHPQKRQQVDYLRQTLRAMLRSVNASEKETHLVNYTITEWKVYSICFHELIRQVSTNCRDRAKFLSEIRKHVAIMIQRLSNQSLGLQNEISELKDQVELLKTMNQHLDDRFEEFKCQKHNQEGMLAAEAASREIERRHNPRRRSMWDKVGLLDDDYKYDFKLLDQTTIIKSQLRYHRYNAAARVIQRRFHVHQHEYFVRAVVRLKRQNDAAKTIQGLFRWHRDNARRFFQSLLARIIKQKQQRAFAILMIQKWVKKFRKHKAKHGVTAAMLRRSSAHTQGAANRVEDPKLRRSSTKTGQSLKYSTGMHRLTTFKTQLIASLPDSLKDLASVSTRSRSEMEQLVLAIEEIVYPLLKRYCILEEKAIRNSTREKEKAAAVVRMPTEPLNRRERSRRSILTKTRTFKRLDRSVDEFVSLQRHIREKSNISARTIKPVTWLKSIMNEIYQFVGQKHHESTVVLASAWNIPIQDLMRRFSLTLSIAEWKKACEQKVIEQLNPDLAKGVFKFFLQKFGIRQRVDQAVQDLIITLKSVKDTDCDLKTFSDFVSYERPSYDLSFYLFVRTRANELGGFIKSSKDGYVVDGIDIKIACRIGQELLRIDEQEAIVQTDGDYYQNEFQCYLPERVLEQFTALIGRLDQLATQHVSFHAFFQLLNRFAAEQDTRFRRFQWCRERFSLVDENQDEYITMQEFFQALSPIQPHIPNRTLSTSYNRALAATEAKQLGYRTFLSCVWHFIRSKSVLINTFEPEDHQFIDVALKWASGMEKKVQQYVISNHEVMDPIQMAKASNLLRLQMELEQEFLKTKCSTQDQSEATANVVRLFDEIQSLLL